jgi:high-affinity nickel-transport protein
MTLLLTLVTSLLLGMRHALDPDHIVAVSTIVTRERTLARAARLGVAWGLGHTLTIFVVGGAIILLELTMTPRLGLSLEMAVAVMLLLLGALNLLDVRASSRAGASARPFLVGLVHGLAGSAAVTLVILPLIPDPRWAILYLVTFGLGTIVGMALVTIAVVAPASLAMSRVAGLQHWIRVGSGALSVGFGLYLAYRVGVVDGLFSAAPRWTPQ